MNNFKFVITVKSNKKDKLVTRMERLQSSVDEEIELVEIEEFDLDTDPHYLGLLAIVFCGEQAASWFDDAGRAFIDSMNISEDSTKIYARVNGIDENFFQKIIKNSDIDLSFNIKVDEDSDMTIEEYLEDFEININ